MNQQNAMPLVHHARRLLQLENVTPGVLERHLDEMLAAYQGANAFTAERLKVEIDRFESVI